MNEIKKKLIHFLGGFTEEEHNNIQNVSICALKHLAEDNKTLQKSLRALEHAVEDSRATGMVNLVKVEKPIHTFRIENILGEESRQTEEENIVYTKRFMAEQFVNTLLKDNMIDFKVSNRDFNKIITGTIYVREP